MIHDDRNQVYNIVSLVFLGLTVLCCLVTGVFALGIAPVPFIAPPPFPSVVAGDFPTAPPLTQPVMSPASPEAVASATQDIAESGKTPVVAATTSPALSTTPLPEASVTQAANEPPTVPAEESLPAEVFPTATDALNTFTAQIIHTVVAGDRVGVLAERYGSTGAAIIAANNLNADALIIVGQELIIPVPEAVAGTHIAQVSPTPTTAPTTPTAPQSPSTAIADGSSPISSTPKPDAGAGPAESDGPSAVGAILGLALFGGIVVGLGYGGYRYRQTRAGKGLEEEDSGPSVSRLLDLTTQAKAKQPEPQVSELEEPEPEAPKDKSGPTIRTRLLSPARDIEEDDDFWDSLSP